ncbi:uncharacterized protein LOC114714913 [Neltuma alba]|uniref:uncharacterized protein LOC114714913 n=1 Tax=Neltuma alba TaxID=207710 RepID=UPI0010A34199|nr:uncharacterized protein LOC114714913 [Prosopis alba]
MAVFHGSDWVVSKIVNLIVNEEKTQKAQDNEKVMESGDNEKSPNVSDVLGAKNNKGNTPLHLAASYECRAYYDSRKSIDMSTKIGEAYPSSVVEPNNAGETPLFLAALHGNREVFLWLHYHIPQDPSSSRDAHYKRDDNNDTINDTILHCAIAGGHIDVAIEILHLYKNQEMTIMRNKNGLYPLHILAATPSAFKSTDLGGRSFIVRLLYHWFKVKKKEQATTEEAIFQQREHEARLVFAMVELLLCSIDCVDTLSSSWVNKIRILIGLLWVSALFLLLPLIILEFLFSAAGIWLLRIRKLKEKHKWSLQILEQFLQHPSCGSISEKPYEVDSEAGSKIVVDTPLIIAAKNGVREMVEGILKSFPNMKKAENDEGKNIVLLAVEKRQTKLYQFLHGCSYLDDAAFSKVDKDGNTALHLAAKLGVNLNMQTTTMVEEYNWFDVRIYFLLKFLWLVHEV